jgi:hypothetical protein
MWVPYDIADEPEIVGRAADGRPIYRRPEGPTMLDRVREHLPKPETEAGAPAERPARDSEA